MTNISQITERSKSSTLSLFLELPDQYQGLSVQTQTPLANLYGFGNLPPELRIKIWEHSMERKSRTLGFLVEVSNATFKFHCWYQPPVAHAINRESREEVFRQCVLFPQTYYDTRKPHALGRGYNGCKVVKKYVFVRSDIDILRMEMLPFALECMWKVGHPFPVSQNNLSFISSPYFKPIT
jgi:hypothetical protein